MIPWKELGRAEVPGEDQPLILAQRGTEFAIRIGSVALMSSLAHGSEEALAELACTHIADRPKARVLIGGLGMGYTLAAALKHTAPTSSIVVAELLSSVVEWNHGPLAHLAGAPLTDPRVSVTIGDVVERIGAKADAWDAILLDVDNGPDALTRPSNDRLYQAKGLRVASEALREGGVLGVWSVAPDEAFAKRLATAGFDVHEATVRVRRTKGTRHVLWIATKVTRRRPKAR